MVQCGGTTLWIRGLVSTIVIAVCLILHIAAMSTTAAQATVTIPTGPTTTTQFKSRIGLFRMCTSANGVTNCQNTVSGNCGSWKHKVRATQAFYLIPFFITIGALAMAVVNMLGKIPSAITVMVIAVVLFFELIGWALAFSLFTQGHCGGGSLDDAGYSIGASAPLLLVVWIALIVVIILNLVLQAGPHDDVNQFQQGGRGGGGGGGNDPYHASSTRTTTTTTTTTRGAPPPKSAGGGYPMGGPNDWQWDSASGYSWSEHRQLYRDEGSGHLYNPQNNQWYNPSTRAWYRE